MQIYKKIKITTRSEVLFKDINYRRYGIVTNIVIGQLGDKACRTICNKDMRMVATEFRRNLQPQKRELGCAQR